MLQVIGAGFGRTGTHSLGEALEKLGFGPCYNIPEVAKNPGHTEIWETAMDGKPIDWNLLFAEYKSSVEWPAVAFLPELLEYFSDAKFILTLRDPESWYESARTTIFEALELSSHNPDLIKRERSGMKRRLILDRTFGGRYRDKKCALEVYQKHIQNVIDLIPSGRLLQFNIKEGWEPLCSFLGKPIPNASFPKLNERSEFLASTPDWAKKLKQDE